MKKTISILTSLTLLLTTPVFGQDDTADAQEDEAVMAPPPKPVNKSELQNWLFAGGSLITAALAIVLVAWNPGAPPPPGEAVLPE
ncbi:MAG TPA: hypothetical protein VHL30_00130 [Chlamydiales bacterium]|jgi:hypothetical protein|nr:hypothetical protein [Chlamydiales bacterium]